MKVAGVVFSARKTGNGFGCMRYCLDRLDEKGFKTVLVNAFDYEMKPCSHCNYECYAEEIRGQREECPLRDDIPRMYDLIEDADVLLFAVPNYRGHVSGLYKAWIERLPYIPGAFRDFEDFCNNFLKKVWGFVVIGNLTAMGDMALHEVLVDFYHTRPPETILLQAREHGRVSLKGDLMDVSAVRERLDRFVEVLIKRIGKEQE